MIKKIIGALSIFVIATAIAAETIIWIILIWVPPVIPGVNHEPLSEGRCNAILVMSMLWIATIVLGFLLLDIVIDKYFPPKKRKKCDRHLPPC